MDQWQERKRPVCLERRFEFDSYSATRDFLDKLGDHSEATLERDGHRLAALALGHLDLPGNRWWPLRQDGPLSN